MNESLFARRIKEALDTGLEFAPETLARLKRARERAIESRRADTAEASPVGRGLAALRLGAMANSWVRILLPVAFLIAGAIALQHWQEAQQAARAIAQQAAEIEEVDAGLLTGDLPIPAYLDEDFQSWLKQSLQ